MFYSFVVALYLSQFECTCILYHSRANLTLNSDKTKIIFEILIHKPCFRAGHIILKQLSNIIFLLILLQQEQSGVEGIEQFREITNVVNPDIQKLRHMGVLTGLAIAIHNFPEGLATFVGTLSDPSLG